MPDHQPKQDSKAYNHFLPFLNSAWKVLIDTSAFMNDGAQQFFTVNVPLLLEKKLYLITPLSCVRELERHASAQGPRPNESMEQFRCRQNKGKRGLAIVKTLLGMKVLEVRGEAGDDRVADGVFHRVVIQHRRHYNLLLITNDRDLATDIFEMNEMRSLASKKEIAVRRIKEDGNLGVLTAKNNPTKPLLADRGKQPARAQRYRQAKDAHSAPHETQANAPVRREALNRPAATAAVTNSDLSGQTSSNTKADNRVKPFARQTPPPRVQQTAASANTPKPRSDRFNRASHGPASGKPLRPNFYRFPLASVVTSIPDDPVPVSEVPTTTAILHDEAGRFCQLLARLGSGGEGAVYETTTPFVAKIYHRGKVTRRKIEKIRRLTEHPIDYPGICSPQTMLFNDREEFVGFLMKRAAGHDLNRCLMVRPLLEQRFAGWKKADLVRLCITILEKIRYLHERNIILGDINLSNVRVVSPTEVYLVDCDSYQVGDIPCPVGMVNFTPPEIRGDYNAILRTKGNEYFAVATMIFMILVPGKTPYAHKEGGQGSENIAEGLFPYPYEDKSTGKVPYGLWGFIWSHMSYEVKRAFGNTFDKNGLFYEEKKRLTVDNWLDILGNYLRLLTNGTMATQDPMSVEIYPTRFKRHPESRRRHSDLRAMGRGLRFFELRPMCAQAQGTAPLSEVSCRTQRRRAARSAMLGLRTRIQHEARRIRVVSQTEPVAAEALQGLPIARKGARSKSTGCVRQSRTRILGRQPRCRTRLRRAAESADAAQSAAEKPRLLHYDGSLRMSRQAGRLLRTRYAPTISRRLARQTAGRPRTDRHLLRHRTGHRRQTEGESAFRAALRHDSGTVPDSLHRRY